MLRLIDANLDRIREGLRVLEDIARFVLDDASLAELLKKMRHDIAGENGELQMQLLYSRKAGSDVGAFLNVPQGTERKSLLDVTVANARRVEEALRVVEEIAKLPDSGLMAETFQKMRFSVYQIEQDIVARLSRRDKREKMTGLCVVVDLDVQTGNNIREIVEKVIRAGARIIQLRASLCTPKQLFAAAQEIGNACISREVMFVITHFPDVAAISHADGVYLEQDDLPLPEVRRILPVDKIIGCSVTSVAQAQKAEADGADYLSVGPVFRTPLYEEVESVGLEKLGQIVDVTTLPVMAVGGIDRGNIISVTKTGVRSCAVDVSMMELANIEDATRELVISMESISRN